MSEVSVWLLHPAAGYPLALIDAFSALTYTKVTNGVGAFTLTLPGSFDTSKVQEDTRVVIYRKPRGGVRAIDFCGFVRKVAKSTLGGHPAFTVSGYDLNYLLGNPGGQTGRIVAYAAASSQAAKSDQADDMMKAIVRENLGASAIAARNLTAYGFTVQADVGLGTSIEKAFAWRNVLAVLQEIADASHVTEATCVYFGIVPLNIGWECEFRTKVGQWGNDHRFPSGPAGSVVFGLEFANLAEVERSTDYSDEVTYAYAGGQGEESARVIKESSQATRLGMSPFNRRESFIDARQATIDNQVQDAADGAVRDGRPHNLFTGKVLDTSQVYGRDWGHGDYVTGVYAGETIDCRIETVTVTIQNGVETVDATLRSEV